MTGRPADLRWLLGLCRHDLGGGAPGAIDGIDAEAVTALAEAHRVTPIAHRSWQALAARALAPPPPPALAARAAEARRRAFLAAGHLARLAGAFEARGVPWLALKGPALSMQLYGDATLRSARDLDVIVPADRLGCAVSAAAEAAWSPPARWRDLMRITARHDMELRPTRSGQPLLELHARLGPRFARIALDPFAEGMNGTVPIAARPIPTLVGPALTTYVAWHGARGFWYRLSWLVDYARMLPRRPAEAERLLATAHACGAEVAVRAGALFAERLFGIAPPPWPPASATVARRSQRALAWAVERLALGIDSPRVWSRPGSYRWLWREVALQEAPLRAAVDALDHVARPLEADARRLGLGLPLAAHRLARPYFVATRVLHDRAARRR